jgi:diaminopropionate ammonia-lyase
VSSVAFASVAEPRPRVPLFTEADYAEQRAFFTAHPELAPTPLRRLRALARSLGLADLRAKDETARFGLNAFKAAGAMFAIATLRDRGELGAGETLVCASEGNHGRAVARAARDVGCRARVYLADSVAAARVAAIESEGASIVRVPGTYDDAVRVMTADAPTHGWRVISDTALPGDPTEVPRLIMLGYTRLMDEAEAQWPAGAPPDAIFVPGGVGGLLAAVADWITMRFDTGGPQVVCVEPLTAACLQMSARAGQPTTIDGPFTTAMGGLRCGEVSRAGFDTVLTGVKAYIAIEDHWAFEAIKHLATGSGGDPIVEAGASGAAALGGLLAVFRDPALAGLREQLGLGRGARVMIFVTEGATDPELFAGVVGRPRSEQFKAKTGEP